MVVQGGRRGGRNPGDEMLRREPLMWMAARRAAGMQPAAAAGPAETCALRQYAERILTRGGIAYAVAHVASGVAGLQLALAAGLGVACLNESALAPGIAAGCAGPAGVAAGGVPGAACPARRGCLRRQGARGNHAGPALQDAEAASRGIEGAGMGRARPPRGGLAIKLAARARSAVGVADLGVEFRHLAHDLCGSSSMMNRFRSWAPIMPLLSSCAPAIRPGWTSIRCPPARWARAAPAGLDQRQRFEELVQGAEAARHRHVGEAAHEKVALRRSTE